MNTMKWLLKREYWEHKVILFWAPVLVSGLLFLLTIGSMLVVTGVGSQGKFYLSGNNVAINLQQVLNEISNPQNIEFAKVLAAVYLTLAIPLMLTLGFVVFFYCLGCLYDERKDSSILFWKSLPISDSDTVASKALTALIVGPMITITFALTLYLVILFILMLLAAFHGLNLFSLVLGDANFYLVIGQMLGFIPIYVLWALPTVGYLIFVSSWAKTKPFLWAAGIPIVGGVILWRINLMLGSPVDLGHYWQVVWRGLLSGFPGSWIFYTSDTSTALRPENEMYVLLSSSYSLLTTANLWIGVVVGLAFLAGAVRMRRYRDEG